MSRFPEGDDDGDYPHHWAAQDLERALVSKPGQSALRFLRDALDAMPVHALANGYLVTSAGGACAVGVYALAKGLVLSKWVDMEDENAWDADFSITVRTGRKAGLAKALAQHIGYVNDENFPPREQRVNYVLAPYVGRLMDAALVPIRTWHGYTDEQRWEGVRAWVCKNILDPDVAAEKSRKLRAVTRKVPKLALVTAAKRNPVHPGQVGLF